MALPSLWIANREEVPVGYAARSVVMDIQFKFFSDRDPAHLNLIAVAAIADSATDQRASDRFDANGEEIDVMLAEHEPITKDWMDRLVPGICKRREM
jgi:hypothetical protein